MYDIIINFKLFHLQIRILRNFPKSQRLRNAKLCLKISYVKK